MFAVVSGGRVEGKHDIENPEAIERLPRNGDPETLVARASDPKF